jgi:DNA-binding NtrC family response regulator
MARILVVDDEVGIRELLSEILYDEGHTVELAENAAQARAARLRMRPDLVLLDIWMPDTDGVTLLKEWRGAGLLNMPVIMMSGHATIDTAVEATRIGAQAFLEKPITLQKLLGAVEQGLKSTHTLQARTNHVLSGLLPHGILPLGPAGNGAVIQTAAAAVEDDAAPIFELDQPLRDARDAFEKAYFEYHLSREGGSMTRVAQKTGLERTHLYRKLKQLGVDLKRDRKGSGATE